MSCNRVTNKKQVAKNILKASNIKGASKTWSIAINNIHIMSSHFNSLQRSNL